MKVWATPASNEYGTVAKQAVAKYERSHVHFRVWMRDLDANDELIFDHNIVCLLRTKPMLHGSRPHTPDTVPIGYKNIRPELGHNLQFCSTIERTDWNLCIGKRHGLGILRPKRLVGIQYDRS